MFVFLGRYLLLAMEWAHNNIIQNYAFSIIIFTVLLKLITMPADIKQRKTAARTQAIQPKINEINAKFKGNPEVAQRKTKELYKKEKASPTAGCLPMLLTMVVFMVFLRAMTFWSYVGTIDLYTEARDQEIAAQASGEKLDIVKDGSNDEVFKNFKMLWVNNIWSPDSFTSDVLMPYSQFHAMDISQLDLLYDADEMSQIQNISIYDYNRTMSPYVSAYAQVRNGWGILPILAAVSMLIIQLVQKKLQPQQAAVGPDGQPAMNTTMMTVMFAVMSGFICFRSNAGFALYWLTSNIVSFIITLSLNFSSKRKNALAGGTEIAEAMTSIEILEENVEVRAQQNAQQNISKRKKKKK